MGFYFEKANHQLIDPDAGIIITSKSTGVGREWRRVF
jgi:hypothetical protein